MTTTNTVTNELIQKTSPGSLTTTKTTIVDSTQEDVNFNKGLEIFASVFAATAGAFMGLGAILILASMGIVLAGFYNFDAVFGLLVAAFCLWTISSVLNWLPTITGFASTRSKVLILNFIATALNIMGFVLLIAGSGCFLSDDVRPQIEGEILFVVGFSFWLAAMLFRDMGVRHGAINIYKDYPLLPTTSLNYSESKKIRGFQLSSIWSNALATDMYIISAVLFLVGSIMFIVRNNANDSTTSLAFSTAWSVLWTVGAAIVIFASVAHCIARR